MMVMNVPAGAFRELSMSRVESDHEFGGARLSFDSRPTAPSIKIRFGLAGGEARFNFMNSLQNDAHVLPSNHPGAISQLHISSR
jgi:hypothetical protein